jgi:uncharacterized protein (DUF433 family)
MPAQKIDSLTLAETAYVSDVTVRDVNRVIDEKILPGGFYAVGSGRARRFKVGACALIAFYFVTAGRLTAGERIRAISRAGQRLRRNSPSGPEKEWTISDDLLQIKLTPFLKGVRKRLSKLAAARALVVEDPGILGGTPVITGTRIPVYDIAASVQAGLSMQRILAAYPALTKETVELAVLYAETTPPRGRPHSGKKTAKSTIVSNRPIRRRKLVSEKQGKEQRDREGYRKTPQARRETSLWEKAAAWPEE